MKRHAIELKNKEQISHASSMFQKILIDFVERERNGEEIFPTLVEVITEK